MTEINSEFLINCLHNLSARTLDLLLDRELASQVASDVANLMGLPQSSLMHAPRCQFDLACVKLVIECDGLFAPDVRKLIPVTTSPRAVKKACFRRFLRDYHSLLERRSVPTRGGNPMFDEQRCHFPEEYLRQYDDMISLRGMNFLISQLHQRMTRTLTKDRLSLSLEQIANLSEYLIREPFSEFWRTALESRHSQPA